MHKNNKKGFTIVELVIVIAVIAILAAVLIPTFANLAKRANISADTQLIRNLNTALISDSAKNGTHTTMQSALDAAEKFGYDVARINASATDNEILWDSANDVFCYFNADSGEVEYIPETALKTTPDKTSNTYWCIIKATSENVTCGKEGMDWSCYLASSTNSELKTSTGIDVGTLTNVTSIEYTNTTGTAQTVVIRTNGGTLTVNAPADTVKHYGNADSVNIVAVASASYHENGTVPFLQISKGRIELEATADVNGIHVANVQTVDTNGNITKTEKTFSNDVVLTLNSKDVKLTRDTIGTVIATPVLVCEVQANANSDEYIWLFGDGTIENAKVYVTETKTTPDTSVASTTTTENASAAAIAIANNATNTGTEEAPVYVAVEAGTSAENAQVASALKGSGTEEDPFLVYDYATMQKISDFYNKGYYYFAVAIEKTDNGNIDCRNDWIAVKLNGSFDGKGVKFINLDWKLFGNLVPDSYIKNLDIVNCYIRNTGSVAALANYFQGNTLIENVNISGYIEGQGQTAGYASYCSSSTALITFKDCTLTAKVVAIGGTVGGFMVNPYALANQTGDNLGFVIDNSYIEGQLYSTVSSTGLASVPTYCGYVYAHTITVPVQFKNIDPAKASLCYVEKSASHNNSYWLTNERSHLITVANPTLDLSGVGFGETFSLNVSNDVSYATISFLISPNDHNNEGSYTSTYLTETVNAEAGTITSEIVKKYNVAINGSIDGTTQNQVTTDSTGLASDGETYNVVNSSYGYTHNGVSIFIVLYSASGDVLAYTNAEYIAAND